MKDDAALELALKTLDIPDTIRVKLAKSKRAPLYSTLVTYKPSQDGKSVFDYVIEYKKSLGQDLLRHELCHLKLHLMGLPTVEIREGSPMDLISQVLNTLHEDYYASLIMHQKFPQGFLSSFMRGLGHEHDEVHIHGEAEEGLLAWLLQNYALKLVVLETLEYKNEAKKIKEKIEHFGKESHKQLQVYLETVADHLRRLPQLDRDLRPFTTEEKISISRIVESMSSARVPQ